MASSDEEIYSIMFSSLKHPVRRKILRMLWEKPMTFSQIVEELGVSSSHLTYHLESLGELLSKSEDGQYRLSTFGVAAVSTMRIVEETPASPPRHQMSLSLRWKAILTVLIVATLILSCVVCIQVFSFDQLSREHTLLRLEHERLLSWSAGTDESIRFLQDVLLINITAYKATLLSSTVDYRSDLGGVVEEILKYSLTSSESQIDVIFRFRNGKLSRYQLSSFEGAPIYSQTQPVNVLEAAKSLLARFRAYSDSYYLKNMSDMLSAIADTNNAVLINGNIKLVISTSGAVTQIQWLYTEDGIDFQTKSLTFVFENRVLKELTDGWYLFTIGSTAVNISRERAIEIAKDYVKTYKWAVNGEIISNLQVLDEPVSCALYPHIRDENSLALFPYWYVTLYLDKVYPGDIDRITVGIWADTGKIANVRLLST
ncbi:MAG: winged helix-turn-helix domain-containing protein [Candidatus Bathyarchaeia archaeon]